MSGQGRFWVLDHTGAVTAYFDKAAPAVELAKKYAAQYGVADVLRGKSRETDLMEEMADVSIMLNQLELIFGEPIDQEIAKLEQLEERLHNLPDDVKFMDGGR